jgi:CheY-like chemotaxis protein
VEDNAVNRKAAVRLLEKRGHKVVAATDGAEALAKLDRSGGHEFDAVLMDVQMPGMGGFEATSAIRARERTTGAHIPIVAVTASAAKDDLESCLRAGMDAHLAKPIRSADLYRVVESIGSPPSSAQGARAAAGAGGGLNESALMAHVGGDEQLLRELVALFLEDLPEQLAAVRKAVRRQDARALSSAAHALKGALSHFAARDTFESALRLERMGRSADLDGAEEAFARLKDEVRQLTRDLAAYRRRMGPPRDAGKRRKGSASGKTRRAAGRAGRKAIPGPAAGRAHNRSGKRRGR